MQIFHVLEAIIGRLGSDAQPFTQGFLQLLPSVWQQAEGQQLVRMQVQPCNQQHEPSTTCQLHPMGRVNLSQCSACLG